MISSPASLVSETVDDCSYEKCKKGSAEPSSVGSVYNGNEFGKKFGKFGFFANFPNFVPNSFP